MSQIDRAGTFRGHLTSQAIGLSKNGHVQLEVSVVATELYDQETQQWLDWSQYEETELHGYLYLVSNKNEPYKTAEQLKKALGWSGADFSELDETDYSGIAIQFRVQMDTYEGKISPKIAWVDHADAEPGSSIKKLDKAEIKALDAKFAKALKMLSGGAKPKSVPAGKPTAPKVSSDPTPSATESTAPATTKAPAKGKAAPKPDAGEAPSGIAAHLSLPETCSDADEAWAQVEQHVSKEFPAAQVEETWLKTVEDLGGPDAIEEEKAWASVRNIVLEMMTDNPNL